MQRQVIQGFFVGTPIRSIVPGGVARPAANHGALAFGGRTAPLQPKRAPGPPAPAHAAGGGPLQAFGGNEAFEIDPVRLGLVRSGGSPLPRALLAKMEAAFGADFSAVRVHVGPQAARIGAIAFTTGNDLYFAPGRYQPDSVQGQQLIGHELAHVIQQREGRVRAPGSGVAVVQDRALEAEADRLGMRASMHRAPLQPKAAFDGARPAPHSPVAQPMHARGPSQQLQPMKLRSAKRKDRSSSGSQRRDAPPGYSPISKSYKSSLRGKVGGSTENEIYYKLYKGKVLLWWVYPLEQIDDFVYFGDRQDDIDDCDSHRRESGYIWHHTGYPHEEASGVMQLVPRTEHEALPHYGGIFLSKGN